MSIDEPVDDRFDCTCVGRLDHAIVHSPDEIIACHHHKRLWMIRSVYDPYRGFIKEWVISR
jgi:hypothetical protein